MQESGLDRNAVFLIVASFAILIGGVVFVSAKNTAVGGVDEATLSGVLEENPQESLNQILGQKSEVDTLEGKIMPKPTNQPQLLSQAGTSLQIEDLVVGEGAEATNSARISVNYVGTLTNGKKFDSSYERNQPFSFKLGVGEVIKGWDMGILGMKVSGRRKLVVPPNLGYGNQTVGSIPPDSTLVFEIELLDVK